MVPTVQEACEPGEEVFKLPKMSEEEVKEMLRSCRICRMALNDDPQPYIIPLDYVFINDKIYFHFANYGRKVDLFNKNPNVCVEIDKYNEDITDYKSVTLMGRLSLVRDTKEKEEASEALLASIGSRGGKEKVAARHGFECMDKKTLSSKESLLLRLDVRDYIALKSP
ncbi:flavin-nucleotide-binding protein [Methanocella sp. CWC-04]|uniref:Flavin-nucleotide-binding protein n=1 Tax=Methanooceanicella nereidis TaxID=2052831 RepID=A0AAP2W5J2_9EURY|nr:pyridoxamine 5'-phosphate oxidase family protein [Methanocella sp. CWC-04]MCD1293414.1 flavin-nucleotide-binding protein [Methanocella sp. CWC-04]